MALTGALLDRHTGRTFGTYVYLLETTASGRGLTLGWDGLTEPPIESYALVLVRTASKNSERALLLKRTHRGAVRPTARAWGSELPSGSGPLRAAFLHYAQRIIAA